MNTPDTPESLPALSSERVVGTCRIWDIPVSEHSDFRRIALGAPPKCSTFFEKILLRPHYRKALIQCLKEMKF